MKWPCLWKPIFVITGVSIASALAISVTLLLTYNRYKRTRKVWLHGDDGKSTTRKGKCTRQGRTNTSHTSFSGPFVISLTLTPVLVDYDECCWRRGPMSPSPSQGLESIRKGPRLLEVPTLVFIIAATFFISCIWSRLRGFTPQTPSETKNAALQEMDSFQDAEI